MIERLADLALFYALISLGYYAIKDFDPGAYEGRPGVEQTTTTKETVQ